MRSKYDIITDMKKIILCLCVFALAACRRNAPVDVRYVDEYDSQMPIIESRTTGVSDVAYSSPNGNDLRLETDHHVIQINAAPNSKYTYYVWTGGRTYDQDPDLIVEDGVSAVLVDE